jgi:hypothetical protein
MDEKTLQYMGERVDKARELKGKIKELKHFLEYSEGKSSYIQICNHHHNGPQISSQVHLRLFEKAKAAILKEIEEEIKLLEQELAEL